MFSVLFALGVAAPRPPALFLGAPAPQTPRVGGLPPPNTPAGWGGVGGGGGGGTTTNQTYICFVEAQTSTGFTEAHFATSSTTSDSVPYL